MESTPGLGPALGRVLDTAENGSPLHAVEAVTRELGATLSATAVSFLITDLSGRGLVRLAPGAQPEESADALPFDGGPAEQALRDQTVQVLPPGARRPGSPSTGGWTVLAPVTQRGEALGLLEMSLPAAPGPSVVAEIARTAHLLGFVVIANRRHTDMFEWGQRSTPFTLPAEIQRRLLPAAFTCEAGLFTLSAWLEPAATVGGDTFDYSLASDVLHLSVTDAMGHGVASALTATLCVGSLRNTRRKGASLHEQTTAANSALVDYAASIGDEGFVTGLLGRLDLGTEVLTLINAGHVSPYLTRAGVVSIVDLPTGMPLGLFPDAEYRSTDLALEPGDRLILVTDGMLERNAASLDLPAEITATRTLHARETTRVLADKILDITGPTLDDDATLLVLDWHGTSASSGADRTTAAGSDDPGPNEEGSETGA